MLGCKEFVNADEIAKGLSPFNPESVAIEAGRLMLQRMDDLLSEGEDFAFETTLATRSYVKFVEWTQANGIRNLTTLYTPICDYWTIYDNSAADGIHKVAWGVKDEIKEIVDPLSYQKIVDYERD